MRQTIARVFGISRLKFAFMNQEKSPRKWRLNISRRVFVFLLAALVIFSILITRDEERDHLVTTLSKGMVAVVIPFVVILSFPSEIEKLKTIALNIVRRVAKALISADGIEKRD